MPLSKRSNKLSIRLTPEEYKYFLVQQRNSGLSQADFLMKLLDRWRTSTNAPTPPTNDKK